MTLPKSLTAIGLYIFLKHSFQSCILYVPAQILDCKTKLVLTKNFIPLMQRIRSRFFVADQLDTVPAPLLDCPCCKLSSKSFKHAACFFFNFFLMTHKLTPRLKTMYYLQVSPSLSCAYQAEIDPVLSCFHLFLLHNELLPFFPSPLY